MSERPTLRSIHWEPAPEASPRQTGIRSRLIKADGTSADPHARLASARIRREQVYAEWRESLRVLVQIDDLVEALERECDSHDTVRAPAL